MLSQALGHTMFCWDMSEVYGDAHKHVMTEAAKGKKDVQFATNCVLIDLMRGMILLKSLGNRVHAIAHPRLIGSA